MSLIVRGACAMTLLLVAATSQGCLLKARNYQKLRRTGPVATITGTVEAGKTIGHLVPYDQTGTQNNVTLSWPAQKQPNGPRIRVYATSAECADFVPPPEIDFTRKAPGGRATTPEPQGPQRPAVATSDPCDVSLASRGFVPLPSGDFVQWSLILTGGPRQFKPDFKQYKLWVVGDPGVTTTYTISIVWLNGVNW